MSRVTVFGSYNTDLVCFAPHIPVIGETVSGGPFRMGPGGKGFNQAVAARKAGAEVLFIGKIGRDVFAPLARQAFERYGVSTRYLKETDEAHTGTAVIVVDENNGNNAITVAPGTSAVLTIEDVRDSKEAFEGSEVFLTQFETNLEATFEAIRVAKRAGCRVVLNPSPAIPFDAEILRFVDVLIVNEIEAAQISDFPCDSLDGIRRAAAMLNEGVETVVVTLGKAGLYCPTLRDEIVPSFEVKAVDTVGAGDAFAGILSAGLAEGKTLREAIDFARAGAALACTKPGAADAMADEAEIRGFLCSHG
ncbi:ribokinase [bacterium]|nr:ribokinase [bacterium]